MLKLWYTAFVLLTWTAFPTHAFTDTMWEVINSNGTNITICSGHNTTIACPAGEFLMVLEAAYGYSNNTPSGTDASWCVESERTCMAKTADFVHYSSHQEIRDVSVPVMNTTCPDGMTQSYNYVYLNYSCIPYSAIRVEAIDICSDANLTSNASSLITANFPDFATNKTDCKCKVLPVNSETFTSWNADNVVELSSTENCAEELKIEIHRRSDDSVKWTHCSPTRISDGLGHGMTPNAEYIEVTLDRKAGSSGNAKVWLDIAGSGELLQFQCNDAIPSGSDILRPSTFLAALLFVAILGIF